VIAQDGQVIDYFGDGLAAMWNAPVEQADHAARASRAAAGMIESLPIVAADWESVLERGSLRLGIGIHTGIVQVGNSGSQHVKKYGPRGTAVHVASRVEAATKRIGVPLVLSGETAAQVSGELRTYRICQAELPGVERPVDLYGILPQLVDAAQIAAVEAYSRGLALFEHGELEQAKEVLAAIADSRVLPTRFLLQHVEQQLGQRNRRRSSDAAESQQRGVIRLEVK
jgi:adenylate cyclase